AGCDTRRKMTAASNGDGATSRAGTAEDAAAGHADSAGGGRRAVDEQRAAVDIRRAGVGAHAAQRCRSAGALREAICTAELCTNGTSFGLDRVRTGKDARRASDAAAGQSYGINCLAIRG